MADQPAHALIPSGSSDTRESWRPILQVSNQVVLYNPTSHALSVNLTSRDLQSRYDLSNRRQLPPPPSSSTSHHLHGSSLHSCPYCKQTLPAKFHTTRSSRGNVEGDEEVEVEDMDHDSGYDTTLDWDQTRAANYFHLLELSNEAGSGPASPARQSYSSLPPPSSRQGSLPSLPPPLPFLPPPTPPQLSSGNPPLRSTPTPRVTVEVGENTSSTSFGNGSTRAGNGTRGNGRNGFPAEAMAEGYFKAFFQEEYKLGMGANGSVFLCQHVLDGTPLGHFAVKKIAVGESHSYLLKILREVRLLEQMRHPNIITYHHAWLESYQFSPFGPKVPTLHVLMQWAEGGSLDDFIDVRLGRPAKHIHVNPLTRFSSLGQSALSSLSSVPSTPTSSTTPTLPALSALPPLSPLPTLSTPPTAPKHLTEDEDGLPDIHSRSARIRAFRAYQKASPTEKERMKREVNEASGVRGSDGTGQSWKAVHLLGAEEVKSLFSDVVEGLAFLHEKSILHLDLKPGNVLLTWDEGKLIPRAMLSDFGTSRDMMHTSRVRSGNTGTLEYSAPESLPSLETGLLRQIDSKADMWSLGMILHKLLFFRLPYRYASDGDTQGGPLSAQEESEKLQKLENEVANYLGFKSTPRLMTAFEARRLPRSFLILLETLLNIVPPSRPSVERISLAIKEGKFNPQEPPIERHRTGDPSSALSLSPVVMPVMRRGSMPTESPHEDSPMRSAADMDDEDHDKAERLTTAAPMFALRDRVKLLGPPESVAVGVPTGGSGGAGAGEEMAAARWMSGWVGAWTIKNVGKPIMKRWEKTLLGRIVKRAGVRMTLRRGIGMRVLKSCLLSGKVGSSLLHALYLIPSFWSDLYDRKSMLSERSSWDAGVNWMERVEATVGADASVTGIVGYCMGRGVAFGGVNAGACVGDEDCMWGDLLVFGD